MAGSGRPFTALAWFRAARGLSPRGCAWSARRTPCRWWPIRRWRWPRGGHAPVITDANSVRLVRLGALMLAEFGVGAREEDDDG